MDFLLNLCIIKDKDVREIEAILLIKSTETLFRNISIIFKKVR